MWNTGLFSNHHPPTGRRYYSMQDKMGAKVEPPTLLTNAFKFDPSKRFQQPQQVEPKTMGTIYEKCSNFINSTNGYPNNPRKEPITYPPMEEQSDFDEIGEDALHLHPTATLADFLPQTMTTPLQVDTIKIATPVHFTVSPPKNKCFFRRHFCASTDSSEEESSDEDSSSSEEESDGSCDSGDESDFIDFAEGSYRCTPTIGVVVQNRKRVHFAVGKDLAHVHTMHAWSFAYKKSRKGPWEEYARDRERFKNRAQMCGAKLEPIFRPEHRLTIFRERFAET